jgi:hypothetical protein
MCVLACALKMIRVVFSSPSSIVLSTSIRGLGSLWYFAVSADMGNERSKSLFTRKIAGSKTTVE